MLTFRYDTQLLIEGRDMNPDKITAGITEQLEGDSLLVVGSSTLIKIHFHTNTPWRVLEYAAGFGDCIRCGH